ncbi:Cytochrome bc complex cytochrome b subunit [Talaromyces islandicus]|uniref:Cytochrome bc complex cytochrome b subunit n=1 Tax=Talaromyces islandicus TaxID=28573 RepID=A0A0U1MBV8_TALIS|nr:Cytochrome bc complex cytochrome b subunit [Talaromyces islandicus]
MMEERDDYQPDSYWYYAPNKGAPVAFAILFAVSGLWHFYLCLKLRCWKVTGLLPWSAALFTTGFIFRAMGAFGDWDKLAVYIVSQCLLLAGPPIYEAANFLTLGRILYYVPYHSPIHPGRVFTTFLALGLMIESLTAAGASLVSNTSNPKSVQSAGKSLMKVSLILQLIQMAGFVSIVLIFYRRCLRAGLLANKIRRPLHVLLASCILITIRTIYRTVEYFDAASLTVWNVDQMSSILKNEWYFWVFEVMVMYANTTMLNFLHPMKKLPKSNKIYLAKDGVTEVEGPGFQDKRPLLLTFLDPFDVVGMVMMKKRHEKFWEEGDSAGNKTGEV